MKKYILIITVFMILSLSACNRTDKQTETSGSPDEDWNFPETIEMPEEVEEIFNRAIEELSGVEYEPLGYLGEKDGVYCILCRSSGVYPDSKPYYSLVYVGNDGLHNIWDIWMGAHAEKKD